MFQELKRFRDVPLLNPTHQDVWYASYDAPRPRVMGHKIYVPKENNHNCMTWAFTAAYKLGTTMVSMNRWSGFKVLIEYGETAGQTLGWPTIHLLPVPPVIKNDETSNN